MSFTFGTWSVALPKKWIPAFAGMTEWGMSFTIGTWSVALPKKWIPAFAGMTVWGLSFTFVPMSSFSW